jgi:hypothetical protein
MSRSAVSFLQPAVNTVVQPVLKHITHFSTLRNVLCGAGICYAIEQNKFWHVPIAFLVPSIYAGYQGYSNRVSIKDFISKSV